MLSLKNFLQKKILYMEQTEHKKIEFKDKLSLIYKTNKVKIYSFLSVILLILITLIALNEVNDRKNKLISEKYILAGVNFSLNKKEISKNIYQEIIYSKNKFYSILSLNKILENNLVSDENKILEYFDKIENLNLNEDLKDLIQFKKSLYLIKNSDKEKGEELLNRLIEKNSNFKSAAEEVIVK